MDDQQSQEITWYHPSGSGSFSLSFGGKTEDFFGFHLTQSNTMFCSFFPFFFFLTAIPTQILLHGLCNEIHHTLYLKSLYLPHYNTKNSVNKNSTCFCPIHFIRMLKFLNKTNPEVLYERRTLKNLIKMHFLVLKINQNSNQSGRTGSKLNFYFESYKFREADKQFLGAV